MKKEFNDQEEEYLDNLRMENEIKKLKLAMQYGGDFKNVSATGLNPEIESQFLDNIKQFEDAYSHCKTIKVYDLIGKPPFKPIKNIPVNKINKELKKVMNLLHKKNIGLDTLCEVDDYELYRFITEELFEHEVDDMQLDGFTQNFIYEEFHPNHEYDIKNHCKEIIQILFDKERELNPEYLPLTKEIDTTKGLVNEIEFGKMLNYFRDAYESFKLHHFNFLSVKINGESATADFEIKYTAKIEGTNKTKTFSGNGFFVLKNQYDYWCINKMNIPGIL